MKTQALLLLGLLGAAYVAQVELRSQNRPAPRTSPAIPNSAGGAAFRIVFGERDTEPTRWDGSIEVAARIANVEGWRFDPADKTEGMAWTLATVRSQPGMEQRLGPIAPKGVLIAAETAGPDTRFDVKTPLGPFSFTPRQVTFAANLEALGGRVRVERVPDLSALTRSADDQDFPALAQSGDTVFLAYIEFSHAHPELESFATLKQAPANFDWLARPAGGDQVKLMRYSKFQRKWSQPESVSPPHEDCMRAAVAVDGRGRVWVVWAARRDGNFDLYARHSDRGKWSEEIRLTRDPGTDVNPVAATDSAGRVWVAWQAFRGTNLEILAAAQNGDRFTNEQRVSFSPLSDWDPSIAAGPRGDIAVTWDTYDKGDYDVYARRMHFGGAIDMEQPVAIAASENFEARSSAAFDRANRLWVAFETSGQKWGKDFGVYQRKGVSLYLGHTLRVKCIQNGHTYETAGSLEEALRTVPGLTGREGPPTMQIANPGMAYATVPGPRDSFPRIATDADGRVYLSFRSGAGMRSQIGTIYHQFITYYEGANWSRPVDIPQTEGPVDLRPALLSIEPGHLLMAAVTDRRKPFSGRIGEEVTLAGENPNADLVAADVRIPGRAEAPRLTESGTDIAAEPPPEVRAERSNVGDVRGARVTAGGTTYQVMRGEFHRHTELSSDGGADGPLIDAYRYLIDAAEMDWGGCCDHDNGSGREYSWWLEQKLTDAYTLGKSYVGMFSYERSVVYPEGHRNAIFVQRGVRPLPRLPKMDANSAPQPAPDTQMLYRYLRRFNGIVASHTSATQMGTDWRDNDPIVEPVVEIYQGERQNYEMPGAPRATSEKYAIAGYRPLGFVSLALKKGYRLGFESSSDHISTHMSYCNLWVKDRTREAVMEAFRARRVYGATDNILADVRCGEHFMGEEFSASAAPSIRVHLIGTADFAKVHIIRDGVEVYVTEPKTRDVSFEWRDNSPPPKGATSYYYIRGEQSDGQLVWTSPMWIHF